MENIPNNWLLEDVIALTYIKNLNYVRHKQIIEKYHSFDKFLHNAFDIQKGFFSDTNNKYSEKVKEQLELCEKNNVNIISIWNDNYPVLLKEISYPPTILYVQGTLQPSNSMSIAMVGSRIYTTYGKIVAEKFAKEFVNNNIIVTSGLANGIDTISHKSAIKSGGITYAVIASGIDKISPNTSQQLANDIVAFGGAIISEYPCGTVARIPYFPQRNRIISGISKATLVVESAKKGGSLITARFAQDQGREVFAVPGSIFSEQSFGTNWLIHKNTAALAMSPQAILQDLGIDEIDFDAKQEKLIKFNDPDEEKLYGVISHEPIHIDDLLEKTAFGIQELLVLLLQLEFEEHVKQLPGKYYVRN